MDSKDKKVFDVAPPKSEEKPVTAPLVTHKMVAPPTSQSETAQAEPEGATSIPVSRKGVTIAPVSAAETKENPQTETDDTPAEVEAAVEDEKDEAPSAEPTTQTEMGAEEEPEPELEGKVEVDTPLKESAFADISLPNDAQKAAAAEKENMQEPHIYDTKTYYVPIGHTRHRHTHAVQALFAGLITGAIVLAIVYFFVMSS